MSSLDKFFVVLSSRPDIDIEDVRLGLRKMVLEEDRLLGGVHAADS